MGHPGPICPLPFTPGRHRGLSIGGSMQRHLRRLQRSALVATTLLVQRTDKYGDDYEDKLGEDYDHQSKFTSQRNDSMLNFGSELYAPVRNMFQDTDTMASRTTTSLIHQLPYYKRTTSRYATRSAEIQHIKRKLIIITFPWFKAQFIRNSPELHALPASVFWSLIPDLWSSQAAKDP